MMESWFIIVLWIILVCSDVQGLSSDEIFLFVVLEEDDVPGGFL